MSQAPITLFRAETRTLPPRGECFVGAAAADITPHLALPLAGYSSTGSLAQGVHARLFARAFVLEDAAGHRAAIVVLDMMSASRFLVEKVAARVGPSVGIGVDRLLLCGTHTHHGPGNFYGNTLYDALAQKRPGIDLALCDWLAERISQAITDAVEALVPGSLGYGQTTLFGVSRNASLDAFHTNPEALQWDHPGWPGFGAPSNLTPTQRAIDPRLRALVLLDGQRRLVGALSFFGCHPTTLGKHYDLYSSDWVGFALREARQSGGSFTDGSTLALATTTAGDVNALHAGMAQGLDLARFVGCQVGQAIARALVPAVESAGSFEIATWFGEIDVSERTVNGRADTRLAKLWAFGKPALGGAEDGHSIFYYTPFGRPGQTSSYFPRSHPQHPKDPAFGALQRLYAQYRKLEPSTTWPLLALRFGSTLLCSWPGEPTVVVGFRLEQALKTLMGVKQVVPVGYAGDYVGYFTTPQEYMLQRYEGASMLFGRFAATHVIARYEELLSAPPNRPPASRNIEFAVGGKPRERFAQQEAGVNPVEPRPRVEIKKNWLVCRWRMDREYLPIFSGGPAICVEMRDGEGWTSCVVGGEPLDDRSLETELRISRGVGGRMRGYATWEFRVALSSLPAGPHPLRVNVVSRSGFPGLVLALPGR